MMPVNVDRSTQPVLAIVGVGLIGGSFAAALRQASATGRVLGVGRNAASLKLACQLGLIDEVVTLEEAAEQADIILIATPIGVVGRVLSALRPLLRAQTLVTDACSTKADVVATARQALGERIGQFVPGHPIAGAEQTGPEAASADLYRGRNIILTPLSENAVADVMCIRRLWEACGARVLTMEPAAHDTVMASVSHLPHFLSAAYMWQVASAHDSTVRMALAGSGFRDFTRIAAGSPEVWRDIFLSNRDAVLQELQQVKQAVAQAEQALIAGDGQVLQDFLERAALARRLWASRSGLS
ncbi:prephenate dehydrogenase/arogenate dehydrogenase family protein [Pusillimonas sp. ANT_WB101]|uniref:prephenate dehydrogenase n=1 Tax=Pusillimonas sp. ANT_WB101 TaxID=2597356 RepID=UPI0011EC34AB|nr:prephenate dehydrogenase/arogenate dehydrogenase family protein [Pusillimonas sp. ANT_WB101]KAA0911820.1 prephenate dehydrogenase/arogenate dehydrogenase family protein [Pusillimonas sp. ANT_WB101]